ncbi:MAG: DUF6276 family protein [Halobacteriales archaeon]
MDCPDCGTPTVAFAVPEPYRGHAPDGASAALCPSCLTLTAAEDASVAPAPDEADFSRIVDSFPDGEAGAAMALAVGLLVESLTLNRDAIAALFEAVADAGEDPWLVLERLHAAGSVQPDADLGRARRQLEQLER